MPGLVPGSVGPLRGTKGSKVGKAGARGKAPAKKGTKSSWPPAKKVIASANKAPAAPSKPAPKAGAAPAKAQPAGAGASKVAGDVSAAASAPKAAVAAPKQGSTAVPKPSVAPSKPGVAPSKPGVAPSKPAVAAPKPGVAASKPGVAPSKPAVAAPKPSTGALPKKHGVLPALPRCPRPPLHHADDPGPSTASDSAPSQPPRPAPAPATAKAAASRPRPGVTDDVKPNGPQGQGQGAPPSLTALALGLYQGKLERPRRVSEVAPEAVPSGAIATATVPQAPPEGKAAWQERERERDRERDRERRPSACEAGINHRVKSTEARRRWMRRNRIHDTAYGGSSSDEDDVPFPFGHESAAANALLYVGLGTVAVGMVIAFVGTGEKGFKTLELRLIGPTLIAGGVLCCLLRVMLCVCPSRCLLKRFRQRSRHKKQVLALEAAGRIAMGPMGRNMPRHGGHGHAAHKGQSRPSSRTSRPGSRTGSRTCSRTGSRLSRTQSELIRSPSDPNDPSVSGGARGKKRVSIASGCGPGVAGSSGVGAGAGAGVHRPGSGVAASQSSQVLAATSLFLQNEQQASRPASSGRSGLGFTVPSINLPSLVRGRSEDLGDGYVASSVRRLSQSSKRLGSTGDLPLLSAEDIDGDLDDGPDDLLDGAYSYNSGYSPDDAQPGPSRGRGYAAPSTSHAHAHVHAPHAIIVTSPTPSSSPRPAARGGSAGGSSSSDRPSTAPASSHSHGGSGSGGASSSSHSASAHGSAREIILSPGGLGLQ